MKRAAALISLSHDHQHALAVALQLRRADDPGAARRAFLDFVTSEGEEHFRIEEEVLLPFVAGEVPADDPDVARVLREHAQLREHARRLSAEPEPDVAELQATGDLLTGHVRFEERVLFPRIEALLDDARLTELGILLRRAEPASS